MIHRNCSDLRNLRITWLTAPMGTSKRQMCSNDHVGTDVQHKHAPCICRINPMLAPKSTQPCFFFTGSFVSTMWNGVENGVAPMSFA